MIPTRITVLGAGGFVGSHLVPALLTRLRCEIDAVDVDFRKLAFEHPKLRRIHSRIEAPGLVPTLVERSQLVISLSALCNPALYNTLPLEVIDANYTHLLPVVQACASARVRLIHFSTSEVYGRMALDDRGQVGRTMNESETGFLGPVERERWTYACAKQLLERVIFAHGAHGSLPFTIVRLFNVIGPRMDFLPGVDGEGIPRVLAMFMHALLRRRELQLVGGGRQRRTFMAVQDLVEAVCRIVERQEACHNQILNLGNPSNDISIAELAGLLGDVFATRVPGAPPARMRSIAAAELYGEGYDDSESRIPEIEKAKRLLDWEPRLSLAQMLPEIVDSYVQRYGMLPESEAT
jgi:UDP-apiose/xylose synthase